MAFRSTQRASLLRVHLYKCLLGCRLLAWPSYELHDSVAPPQWTLSHEHSEDLCLAPILRCIYLPKTQHYLMTICFCLVLNLTRYSHTLILRISMYFKINLKKNPSLPYKSKSLYMFQYTMTFIDRSTVAYNHCPSFVFMTFWIRLSELLEVVLVRKAESNAGWESR